MRLSMFNSLILILLFSILAEAHIRMTSPIGRMNNRDDAKFVQPNPAALTVPDNPGPCSTFTTPMTTRLQYVAGQTINVSFTETINHPGRFIVQFSPGGGQGFWSPANQLANVADSQSGGVRTLPIKLPATACDTCMMRVLQQMDDQPGEFYVHCFDLKLTAAAPGATPPAEPQPVATLESTVNASDQPKFGGGCAMIKSIDKQDPPNYLAMLLLLIPVLTFYYLRRHSLQCISI